MDSEAEHTTQSRGAISRINRNKMCATVRRDWESWWTDCTVDCNTHLYQCAISDRYR